MGCNAHCLLDGHTVVTPLFANWMIPSELMTMFASFSSSMILSICTVSASIADPSIFVSIVSLRLCNNNICFCEIQFVDGLSTGSIKVLYESGQRTT